MSTVNVAVYGTLRAGFWNYDRFLKGNSELVAEQRLPGFSMYGTTIPHIIKNEDDKDGIFIEVYKVSDRILKHLDMLEGYVEGRDNNVYERMEVDTNAGKAFIYARGDRAATVYGTSSNKVPNGLYSGMDRIEVLSKLANGERVW